MKAAAICAKIKQNVKRREMTAVVSGTKAVTLSKKRDVDMTEGSIFHHLLQFALPLLLGNLFQQMYNMVDTWVVGNYVSNEAYSAVGSVGPIINMLIGFFSGLASGAGVVISQYYGARKYDKVEDTVHTAAVMTLVLGVVFTALGILITPFMLNMMKTPAEVFPESKTYLTIYFAGMLGLMVYNMGSGILRAVGDSKRPFYFLVVSAVINTVLDLVFVLAFGMGVEGVALATIIAQFVSAILVLRTLLLSDSCVRLRVRCLAVHWDMLAKIIKVGIPAALQMAVTAFSNVFVQSYINYFGKHFMSGWTTFMKVDQVLFLPMQSLALSATTFVGQNLGKCQSERAQKGVRVALLMAVGATALLTIPIVIFAPYIVQFFNSEPRVIEYGTMMMRCVTAFHIFGCFNQVYAGALRGSGNSKAPMIIMLSSYVLFRQIYMYVVSNFIANEAVPIIMGYPAGWIMCTLLMTVYYKRVKFSKNRLMEESETK